MANRIGAFVVIPAVFVAGGLAFYGVERVPSASAISHEVAEPAAAVGQVQAPEMGALPPDHPRIGTGALGDTLPPNHPSIGAGASPQGAMPAGNNDAPALTWKMPATWQEASNPNAMRLATYHAPGGVEVSVSRAGGDNEANIQRWIGQFDNVGHEGRAEKTVHGLHVVVVDIAGTFVGGGMGSGMTVGGSAQPRPDSAMVGAIVETRSPPYFFKMTGPAAAIQAARPAFDRLVDGVTPM